MSNTTNTPAQDSAKRLIKQLPTSVLIESYYDNIEQREPKRGTSAYGQHMLVHMWLSDEIIDRLGEAELLKMENIAFGELA